MTTGTKFFLSMCGLILIVGCLFGVMSSTETSANTSAAIVSLPHCNASDFSLSKTKANTEYDSAKLTGIVTSHCNSAAGVQLKWTAYNSDGSVAFSSDFWPASTTNIPPRTDYAFEMMESAPRGDWTYKIEPISVNVW